MKKESELLEEYLDKSDHREFMKHFTEFGQNNYRLIIQRSMGFNVYKLNIAFSEFGEAILKAAGLGNWVSK